MQKLQHDAFGTRKWVILLSVMFIVSTIVASQLLAPPVVLEPDRAVERTGVPASESGDTVKSRSDTYEPMRLALERACGDCHRSDLDTALDGALAVYDLTEEDWDARLTAANLDGIETRLDQFDDDDQSVVRQYLEQKRNRLSDR